MILLITWWVTVCFLKGVAADVMSAALVIYNLTGLKLATRSIMFWSCEKFSAGEAFLTDSFDTKCYTGLHWWHRVFGLSFFCLWCFIIPFGLCVRMRRFRSILCPSIPEEVAEREFGEDELRLRLAIREMFRTTPELRPPMPASEKEMQIYFSLSVTWRPLGFSGFWFVIWCSVFLYFNFHSGFVPSIFKMFSVRNHPDLPAGGLMCWACPDDRLLIGSFASASFDQPFFTIFHRCSPKKVRKSPPEPYEPLAASPSQTHVSAIAECILPRFVLLHGNGVLDPGDISCLGFDQFLDGRRQLCCGCR